MIQIIIIIVREMNNKEYPVQHDKTRANTTKRIVCWRAPGKVPGVDSGRPGRPACGHTEEGVHICTVEAGSCGYKSADSLDKVLGP